MSKIGLCVAKSDCSASIITIEALYLLWPMGFRSFVVFTFFPKSSCMCGLEYKQSRRFFCVLAALHECEKSARCEHKDAFADSD